jgi:hypothetical protein
MNIAIFGSTRGDSTPPMRHREEFSEFCQSLGARLAAIPHVRLRVASDRKRTADYWIVEGFAKDARRPWDARVAVYPRDRKDPFRKLNEERPGLISHVPIPPARKAVSAHLQMLQGADAVLLVGGSDGVMNAGLAALLTRVYVWPVGYFGGGAEQFLVYARALSNVSARMPDVNGLAALN